MRTIISAIVAIGLVASLVGCEKKTAEGKTKAKTDVQESSDEKKVKKNQPVEPDPSKPATVGLVTVESSKGVDATAKALTEAFKKASAISMVATVDYGEYLDAEKAPKGKLLVVSNPKMETPFVETSLRTALELPQRVLVWEDGGTTQVSVNAPAYMAKRHGVERLDLFLSQMETGLARAINKATGSKVGEFPGREQIGIEAGQGLIHRESQNGAAQTADALAEMIDRFENLSLVARIDHQKQAKREGREILPAELLLVKNSTLDAPFVKGSPTAGLDVPHPMLVYENERGQILISFNDPTYVKMRHGLDVGKKPVEKTDALLKKVVAKATKEQ